MLADGEISVVVLCPRVETAKPSMLYKSAAACKVIWSPYVPSVAIDSNYCDQGTPPYSSKGKPSVSVGLFSRYSTISSRTFPGDRCIPRRFNQKHSAPNWQFPSPGGLCIRVILMWGKSRSKKRSQVVKGIINFFLSFRNPCFFCLCSLSGVSECSLCFPPRSTLQFVR